MRVSSLMQKLIVLLMSLAVLATACGASDGDSGADVDVDTSESASATETDDSSNAAAENDSGESDSAETDSAEPAEAAPASVDLATCGFGDDLTADRIVVDQIPGDGRDSTIPSALRDSFDPAFDPPLIDVNRVISGGPPPDGIPPVDAPVFQTASTVDWINCNEPVLSLRVGDETRAYPVQILTWHELVNDTFGDVPVTVSYCPLCNSSLAYSRDFGDRIVTFGTSGRLFNSSLVMYDRETESLWTHFNGQAVIGDLVGTQLELLPMQTTSWQSFLQANPDGLVLTRETGHDRAYGQNPYAGYDDVTTSPFLLDIDADPRLQAKQRIVGIRRGGDSAAVILEAVQEAGVLATDVGGDTLSIWHLPGTATALEAQQITNGRDIGAIGVYLPVTTDGMALTFSRDGEVFVDAETGSSWNIQGLATDGELAGTQLEPVEHLDTFWFALAAFEPDTRVVEA